MRLIASGVIFSAAIVGSPVPGLVVAHDHHAAGFVGGNHVSSARRTALARLRSRASLLQ
jgi:hypothetical protein